MTFQIAIGIEIRRTVGGPWNMPSTAILAAATGVF
jgi:hypothetical protein